MKTNTLRKTPLKHVDKDYFIVHRFPPGTSYSDAYTDYIKRFKANDKQIVEAWSKVVVSEINNNLNCDYIIRVLGHKELKAEKDKPLDIVCKNIVENCGLTFPRNALTKRRETKQFSKNKLKINERKRELEGNYEFNLVGIKKNPSILLIDDVTTSGTTVDVISKEIKLTFPSAKITFLALGQTTNNRFSGEVDNSHFDVSVFEDIIDSDMKINFTFEQVELINNTQVVLSKRAIKYIEDPNTLKPEIIQQKIFQFLIDSRGGGFNPHPIDKTDGKWEFYLSKGVRVIYEKEKDVLKIWDIGVHSIIDRIRNRKIGKTLFQDTDFSMPEFFRIDTSTEIEIGKKEYTYSDNDEIGDNPFTNFPNSHLRIIGVPPNVVEAVKKAPSIESLENIPALPDSARNWLEQIYLDEKFEEVIHNPSDLIYRTSLDKLEGYTSGQIKKLMINLDEDQQMYVDKDISNPYLLKGCAGSGKTTIGIHKAISKASEGFDIAYFTFNNNLSEVSKQLIEELSGPLPENLIVSTIDAFANKILGNPNKIQGSHRVKLIRKAIENTKNTFQHSLLDHGLKFIDDEINLVIQGYGIKRLEDYLEIPRYGRKKALMRKSREIIWNVYRYYVSLREREKLCDWAELSSIARDKVKFNDVGVRKFDYINIDETQDLSPIQVRFVQSLLKNSTESYLFCMADAGQSIYAKGLPWKTAGLEIAGRTTILSKNYRNTKQIAEFAKEIIEQNISLLESNEYIPPDSTNKHGPKPEILGDKIDNEVERIYNRMMDLIGDQTFRLSDVSIICRTNDRVDDFYKFLRKKNIPVLRGQDSPFNVLEEKVKLLTIHKAKGLEFPVVFLPSINHNLFPYKYRCLTEIEEKKAQEEKDLLLLYVAITRAAEALYIYPGNNYLSPFIDKNSERIRLIYD